ncbi:hypothetical protein [Escherichia coli]|uniref:hypothetical protein n=1 Tax=Escherichia coli TaxID=562 RepID=UPI00351C60E8
MEIFDCSIKALGADLTGIDSAIRNKKDFDIINIPSSLEKFNDTVRTVESRIEKQGLKCGVYTEYRSSVMAGSFWGPTAIAGAFSAAAIGVHNLATWNPDYEIGKNYVTRTLSVRYKKN